MLAVGALMAGRIMDTVWPGEIGQVLKLANENPLEVSYEKKPKVDMQVKSRCGHGGDVRI